MLGRHPKSHFHYYAVVPSQRGAFTDVWNIYRYAASMLPWLSLLTVEEFVERRQDEICSDPDNFVLLWDSSIKPLENHACKIGAVYAEAIGDPERMLPSHTEHYARFIEITRNLDVVFVHTQWMQKQLQDLGRVAVLPLGYAPTMGAPEVRRPLFDLVFYGSMTRRRDAIIPWFQQYLGRRFHILEGAFGTEVNDVLNQSKGVLYIAHSEVESFSTWRAWQACASSAILLAERSPKGRVDSSPFVDSVDFLSFDMIRNESDVAGLMDRINALDEERPRIAQANEMLRTTYRVDHVIENFLVPTSMALR